MTASWDRSAQIAKPGQEAISALQHGCRRFGQELSRISPDACFFHSGQKRPAVIGGILAPLIPGAIAAILVRGVLSPKPTGTGADK